MTTVTTKRGFEVTFRDQKDVPWKQAKRLMRLKDGATLEDLEFALAVMIKEWKIDSTDGRRLSLPRIEKDGTVTPNGLDELTSGEVNELAELIGQSNTEAVGK